MSLKITKNINFSNSYVRYVSENVVKCSADEVLEMEIIESKFIYICGTIYIVAFFAAVPV